MPEPKDVTTSGIEVVEVLRDAGPNEWSIARLRKNYVTSLGIRWNGDGERPGYPSARGYPVWFQIPDEVAEIIERHYVSKD